MHEICKCTCRLDASVSNNQQRWNEDKCWWECKELVDKGSCDNRLTWNPSSFECKCDKSHKCKCDVREYLD